MTNCTMPLHILCKSIGKESWPIKLGEVKLINSIENEEVYHHICNSWFISSKVYIIMISRAYTWVAKSRGTKYFWCFIIIWVALSAMSVQEGCIALLHEDGDIHQDGIVFWCSHSSDIYRRNVIYWSDRSTLNIPIPIWELWIGELLMPQTPTLREDFERHCIANCVCPHGNTKWFFIGNCKTSCILVNINVFYWKKMIYMFK